MRYFFGLACLLLAWPSAEARAENEPAVRAVESLLAADSVLFLRYDGYDSHKIAYEKTALGKAMKDDLGDFLEYLALFLTEKITLNLQEDQPGETQQLAGSWKHLTAYLWQHGLAAGVEINKPRPGGKGKQSILNVGEPVRLTVVFPEGGNAKNRAVLLPILNALAGNKEKQVGKRILHYHQEPDKNSAVWWQEDSHLVLVLGNDDNDDLLAVADGKSPSLQSNPLFQESAGFKDYETDIRGFVNLRKIVDLFRVPDAGDKGNSVQDYLTRALLLNQLGLTSISSAVFHLGFDRQYQRGTILVHLAEPPQRAGLARLIFSPLHFDEKKLPALPPDAASVRVSHLDWKVIHELTQPIALLLKLQGALDPGMAPMGLDPGVDFTKDIFPYLDSTMVWYNSYAEGPSFLGQGIAIKVKDEKKLAPGLHKLMRWVADTMGGEVTLKTYRGVDMSILTTGSVLPVAPTLTIHKGWLVVGLMPQIVKGYILRSEGKHAVWQAPALVEEALALAKKKAGPKSKLAAITVTDPRPTVTVGLSLLPLLSRFPFGTGLAMDVAKIPNAQALTEWQFPGVTVLYDDGNALRWESHSSFEFPGDTLLMLYFGFALGGRFF